MWQTIDNNQLYKKFQFSNFTQAFAFLTQVAFEAEKQNHHPKIVNIYNTVELWLSTHDAGNIVTQKDHDLAKAIDEIKF